MREINIAEIIIKKRREKGVTQEELATYVGVSKASVSKWENGNSYPDITLLPVIASYFNITLDDLMQYSPMLSDEEVNELYVKLADLFANGPFEYAVAECEGFSKKYYHCLPLVMQIALLYINHAAMADSEERSVEVLQEAIRLCTHVQKESRDVKLIRQVMHYRGLCYVQANEPQKAIDLLSDEHGFPAQEGDGYLMSQAYQLLGNIDKANEVEQSEMLKGLFSLFESLISYLRLNVGDFETALPVFERAEQLITQYNMKQLNANSTGNFYVLAAMMYNLAGKHKEALGMLTKFTELCIHDFWPVRVQTDDFFNRLDDWLKIYARTSPLPRNEVLVNKSMLYEGLLNPAFENLHNFSEFNKLVTQLKKFIGED